MKKKLNPNDDLGLLAGLEQARQLARMAEEGRRRSRAALVSAIMIGVFALAGVFAYLEVTREEKPGPAAVETNAVWEERKVSRPVRQPESQPVAPSEPRTPAAEVPAPEAAVPEQVVEEDSAPEGRSLAQEEVLVLTGLDAGRDAAESRGAALFKRAVEERLWSSYRELLQRSIHAALPMIREGEGGRRFEAVWNEPALYQAILRWKTLGFFPGSTLEEHVKDEYSAAFLRWLLEHDEAMEEFLLTVRREDDSDFVLKFLMDAWSVETDDFPRFYSLALACAVVFDRPVHIPHMIGEPSGASDLVDPLKRFLWFMEKDKAGKLAAPVHRSDARDLIWVVCAPVTTSELEWAIGKLHYNRKKWGNAYGRIEYLMERAVEGLDPYEEYSFAEILKEGGICSDQSYFCVNTARAQGIPAMELTGVTDLGGHAWAGLKLTDDEWSTSTGRIGGVSKGETGDPQTGRTITEQDILQWNHRQQRSPAITLATWRHLWLADFFGAVAEDERRSAAIRLANRIGPAFPQTWEALFTQLEVETEMTGEPPAPGNLGEWEAFAKDMRREFKDNPRMAVLAARAESDYIFPYGEEGDARRLMLRERRRLERDSAEQKDLIATSLKREADLLKQRGGTGADVEIMRLYDRALRQFGGNITGFRMIASDYYAFFRNDPEQARKVARDIELAFKRTIETGDKNWFRANAESDLYRMICGYYREAGDPERAEMLEKRMDVLIRRARRGAL